MAYASARFVGECVAIKNVDAADVDVGMRHFHFDLPGTKVASGTNVYGVTSSLRVNLFRTACDTPSFPIHCSDIHTHIIQRQSWICIRDGAVCLI